MLLQEREADAQMTWFSAVDDPEEFDDWVNELEKILNAEAERYSNNLEISTAWLIRQHLAEISPQNLCNLAELTRLSLEQPVLDPDEQNLARLIEVLEGYTDEFSAIEGLVLQNLVEQTLTSVFKKKIDNSFDSVKLNKLNTLKRNQALIDIASEELKPSLALLQLYLQKLENSQRSKSINSILLKLRATPPQIELVYIKVCLDFYPDSPAILGRIAVLLQNLDLYLESVEFGLQTAEKSLHLFNRMFGYYSATRGLLNAGFRLQEAQTTYAKCYDLLQTLIQQAEPMEFDSGRFIACYGIFTYILNDTPAINHPFLGKLGTYYQFQIRRLLGNLPPSINRLSRLSNRSKKLRIGYISECLYCHSVGWISRWLLLNYNSDKFDVFVYSLIRKDDHVQVSIQNTVTSFYHLTVDADAPSMGIKAIAEKIQNDGIDILIDLDALTIPDTCAVIALKPAPIQITWLGSDASGIPAIDYFIADPYVLPDNAQSYYSAKIWRLPYTYVAVNGFEVGTPNLRRIDLDIPEDAIVYFSVQAPHKRHPDVFRHQMQILRQVPNSYFLIKNSGVSIDFEEQAIGIALEEGISSERLRFLPLTPTSEIHRANFAIADIVLDTYPYNGATTTLEALWMELPIVTRVGQQFVARNSYTMMVNAGISEGIAWTDDEYIEWGIRLGKDADLRQQISWKLKKSKQTSPLWDVKQFVKEMESAYEQMWAKYVESETQGIEIDESQLQAITKAEEQNSQGIIFAQEDNLEQAIACFKFAASFNPEYVDAHYNLGIALDQKNEFEAAIASLKNAIELNPEYANAYFNLGLVLTHQDKPKEAVSYFQQALNLSPQDFEYHLALGNALLAQRKWEEALTAYRTAIQINPKSDAIFCSMGLALGSQQKYTEAVFYLQSAIKIDPESAEAHNTLGWVLSKLDNQQIEAIQCFQTAINLDPDLAEAYINLINLLNGDKSPLGKSYPLQKELADRFLANCKDKNRVRALINSIDVYTKMGLADQIFSLVDELEILIYQKSDRLTKKDVFAMYMGCTFLIASLRDDRQLNSKTFRAFGDWYINRVVIPDFSEFSNIIVTSTNSLELDNSLKSGITKSDKKLRIGILSSHFGRHPVGWCSLDVIRELSHLTPHIYLYSTSEITPDERTQ
jgi:predicted O-linked N-acetylglucosamine transferase (SPINDLY family)